MTQLLTTTLRMGEVASTPTTTPLDVVTIVQLVTAMFSHGPYPANSSQAFSEIASSPQEMWQSLIRTLRHRSRSIPSQLGIFRSPSMRTPQTSTSSHPVSRKVHKAPSRKVVSRMVTPVQPRKNTVNGRALGQR